MSLLEVIQKLIKLLQNARLQTYIKIGLSTIFVWFIWKNRARRHPTIVNRPGFIPIIGHLHYMLGLMPTPPGIEKFDHFKDIMLSLNKDLVHSSRFGGWSTVYILDPKLIKYVFEDKFDEFDKGAAVRDRLFELLGDGIFASDGEIWRKHRKVGSRMFSMRNLKYYMFDVAMTGNARWMKKIEQLRIEKNEIDIYDLLAIYTLDVFVEIAFGESLEIIEAIPKPHPFSVAFDNALTLLLWRFRMPFYKILKYFQLFYEAEITKNVKEIDKFANQMIASVRKDKFGKNRDESNKGKLTDELGKGKHNILSLFLKDNPDLTTNELRDIAMNFIIAGRDTTRILLSWFLYELSLPHNQGITDKIVAEIDNFYEKEKELTYTNIQNYYGGQQNGGEKANGIQSNRSYFKYLEAALLETLRIHPAVPFLLRFAKQDTQIPGGHIIKKGTGVICLAYCQGYNTRVWGNDAAIFKPERFVDKGLKSFEPHVFPAFNIAPRLCLGRHVAIMEAKLVTIKLLQNYRFEAVKNQKVTKTLSFVLNMENGFKIHLYPRDKK